MILGHFVTVWGLGQIERMPFRTVDGRLHGPGIYDMKSGIAVAMLACRALAFLQLPRPPVVMLFTTDEEIGSGSSRRVIEEEALRSRAVLVLEPPLPGGGVKTSRKGVGEFELTVHGASAHAGIAPAEGANALHELAHQILAIQALQDLDRGLSVNVTVASAGSRSNVIPDLAHATIDVRVATMDDAKGIEAEMRRLQPTLRGTRISVEGGINRPPMERTPQGLELYGLARDCARELGKDLGEGGTGGGSDGNFTAALGVPTLDGLGPEGDGAHALQEHVLLADLPWRAAWLARLLGGLAAGVAR
jgi:glutamate carboxypeptidase